MKTNYHYFMARLWLWLASRRKNMDGPWFKYTRKSIGHTIKMGRLFK